MCTLAYVRKSVASFTLICILEASERNASGKCKGYLAKLCHSKDTTVWMLILFVSVKIVDNFGARCELWGEQHMFIWHWLNNLTTLHNFDRLQPQRGSYYTINGKYERSFSINVSSLCQWMTFLSRLWFDWRVFPSEVSEMLQKTVASESEFLQTLDGIQTPRSQFIF